MAFEIANWNIAENRLWFVRLEDGGTGIKASVHKNEEDAKSGVNPTASAVASGFGSNLPVSFSSLTRFLEQYDWHMLVSGQSGDQTKILKVKPFIDLPEISHAIYANSDLAMRKAKAEIDAHTHVAVRHRVDLGIHKPETDVADVLRIVSVRAGVDMIGQVTEHRIIGEPDRLVSSMEITSYMELSE